MRKTLIASLLSVIVAAPAMAADSPHTFTGNVTLASEYLYRGIAQTNNRPAIQGGFDYSHASGFYLGNWNSSISWIGDAGLGASAATESDFYGGFKFSAGPIGIDLGALYYMYPGKYSAAWDAAFDSPDTLEVYAAATYKWFTLKYSHSTTTLFGTKNSEGSGYLELNAALDLGSGWGVNGHIGMQKVSKNSIADYNDYKVGITKDAGFGVFGLYYSSTDADKAFYYNAVNTDTGRDRVVLTFGKTF